MQFDAIIGPDLKHSDAFSIREAISMCRDLPIEENGMLALCALESLTDIHNAQKLLEFNEVEKYMEKDFGILNKKIAFKAYRAASKKVLSAQLIELFQEKNQLGSKRTVFYCPQMVEEEAIETINALSRYFPKSLLSAEIATKQLALFHMFTRMESATILKKNSFPFGILSPEDRKKAFASFAKIDFLPLVNEIQGYKEEPQWYSAIKSA